MFSHKPQDKPSEWIISFMETATRLVSFSFFIFLCFVAASGDLPHTRRIYKIRFMNCSALKCSFFWVDVLKLLKVLKFYTHYVPVGANKFSFVFLFVSSKNFNKTFTLNLGSHRS